MFLRRDCALVLWLLISSRSTPPLGYGNRSLIPIPIPIPFLAPSASLGLRSSEIVYPSLHPTIAFPSSFQGGVGFPEGVRESGRTNFPLAHVQSLDRSHVGLIYFAQGFGGYPCFVVPICSGSLFGIPHRSCTVLVQILFMGSPPTSHRFCQKILGAE